MKHTACGEELERLFKESEERRRCLYPNSRSVEKALLRRVEAKEVYSPYPGLFERSCWSAQEYRRLVATRVVKTLAELHPEWVFTSFSAALMYGLWVPYVWTMGSIQPPQSDSNMRAQCLVSTPL